MTFGHSDVFNRRYMQNRNIINNHTTGHPVLGRWTLAKENRPIGKPPDGKREIPLMRVGKNFRAKFPGRQSAQIVQRMAAFDRETDGGATLLRLALGNANQTLNTRTSTTKDIMDAISPLVAFDWDSLVIQKVGSDPMNKFLQNLRNSIVPQTGYSDIRNTILNGIRGLGVASHATVGFGQPEYSNSGFLRHYCGLNLRRWYDIYNWRTSTPRGY